MNNIILISPIVNTSKEKLYIPLNLVYLASCLKQDKPSARVDIIDLNLEFHNSNTKTQNLLDFQKKILYQKFQQCHYDIVGISGLCDTFPYSILLAKFLKKHFNPFVVLGGPHSTFIAEELLVSFDFIDFVIVHEAGFPLCRLVNNLSQVDLGRGKEIKLQDVPNLVYKDHAANKVCRSQELSTQDFKLFERDFQIIYDFIDLKNYQRHNTTISLPILIGCGCPYNCIFCSTSLMWKRKYRVRNVQNIVTEIKYLKQKYGVTRFNFIHDNLIFNEEYTLKLCLELSSLDINWDCSGRLDDLIRNLKLVDALKKSGCSGIFTGIESASKSLQKKIKKNLDPLQSINILSFLLLKGIDLSFSFIIGFPDDSYKDIDDTLKFAFNLRALGVKRVNVHNLVPLPGTCITKWNNLIWKQGMNSISRDTPISYKDKSYSSIARMISRYPHLFTSFYFVEQHNINSRENLLKIAIKAEFFANKFPRCFSFLFNSLGYSPLKVLTKCSKLNKKTLQEMRKFLKEKEYLIFKEIFAYESEIMKLTQVVPHPCVQHLCLSDIINKPDQYLVIVNKSSSLIKFNCDIEYYIRPSVETKVINKLTPVNLVMNIDDNEITTYKLPEDLFSILEFIVTERSLSEVFREYSSNMNHSRVLTFLDKFMELQIIGCRCE